MSRIIVSAGDALTARLIQEAGFSGIWISGFEASARLGLNDDGSITMTEMLNVAKPIVDSVGLPVYVDCDTGYGNFQRTVKEFSSIGVNCVCVEDNLPDKENSLWGGERPLLDADLFCSKIDVKRNGIKIMARTEALIRGLGIDEAIRRADKYAKAGADIILIHTRDQSGKEAIEIAKAWNRRPFLAIVPTKFPHMTNSSLFSLGYNYIVWANQTERVKIKSIRDALKDMKERDCALNIENNLSATLDDMRSLANGI